MVAMEAGSGAHHWARQLIHLGHDARIIDPRFVAPYRHQGRSGKNDINDAVAICEAAGRPQMRFVPVKSEHQQAILVVHRLRTACVTAHTRTINQMRGLLAEFGIVVPRGANTFKDQWHHLRTEQAERVPDLAWQTLDELYAQLKPTHQRLLAFDRQISQFIREDERARRLMQINGIGPITASAIVATVGNGHDFKNGRQFAAWLGLTPRQYSTGGRTKLGKISKRGDVYLRTLLVHGARSELLHTARRTDRKSRWIEELRTTKSFNQAAVALANKHARIAWSLLAHSQDYQPA
jgi:transposase